MPEFAGSVLRGNTAVAISLSVAELLQAKTDRHIALAARIRHQETSAPLKIADIEGGGIELAAVMHIQKTGTSGAIAIATSDSKQRGRA